MNSLHQSPWFSTVLLAALRDQFTGGVRIRTKKGDVRIFFRNGHPVHASGAGFKDHRIGELLVARGVCSSDEVESALAQQSRGRGTRPLLGSILAADASNPSETEAAIRDQIFERLATLMALHPVAWSFIPADALPPGVDVERDGWGTFFELLETRMSAAERRHHVDAVVGTAIRLKASPLPPRTWSAEEREVLGLLAETRLSVQLLHVASNSRIVQGLLRGLVLLDRLEFLPRSKAVTVPRAKLSRNRRFSGSAAQQIQARPANRKRSDSPRELGSFLLRSRAYAEARAVFQAAHRAEPSNPTYMAGLAWAILKGRTDDPWSEIASVLKLLADVYELRPEEPWFQSCVELIRSSGDWQRRALIHVRKLLVKRTRDRKIHRLLVLVCWLLDGTEPKGGGPTGGSPTGAPTHPKPTRPAGPTAAARALKLPRDDQDAPYPVEPSILRPKRNVPSAA